MTKRSKILAVAAGFGLIAVVAWWLIQSEHSPFSGYLLWHPEARNAATSINSPAVFLGFIASGNVHQPSEIVTVLGIFVQWAVIAAAIAALVVKGNGDA